MNRDGHQPRPSSLAIGLIGAATLCLEILLTRIFSVTMWYHFAFMAISLALFGLAASGVVATIWRPWFIAREPGLVLGWSALGFGIAIPVAFVIDLHLPFYLLGPLSEWKPYLLFFTKFVVLSVPFFFSGMTIASAFLRYPGRVHQIYFADLVGGGIGCFMVVPVLTVLSGPTAVVYTAALPCVAAALFFQRAGARRAALLGVAGAIAAVLFVGLNERMGILAISKVKSYSPGAAQAPERPKVFERWHPVSRVAAHGPLYSTSPEEWWYSLPIPGGYPPLIEVTNDGGARTFIYPRASSEDYARLFRRDLTDLPFALLKEPEVLVIGVGGGKDILSALALGAGRVTGVELNPIMLELPQEQFGSFSGRPFDDPRVHLEVDEGRNFVARHPASYDLIKLAGTDTWAASAVGAYALVENYLYTREAMADYLSALRPGGMVAITRWFPEAFRLTVLVADAVRASGHGDPLKRIALARTPQALIVIVKKGDFTPAESLKFVEATRAAGHLVTYAPGLKTGLADRPMDAFLRASLAARDPRTLATRASLDLTPPTDDRPFFFNLLNVDRSRQQVDLAKIGGYTGAHGAAFSFLLGMLLVCSLVCLLFVIGPLGLFARGVFGGTAPRVRVEVSLYFLVLGVGYLLVEIPLMQTLILFLGHPVYALTVALLSLLVFSGLGSLLAARFEKLQGTRLALVVLLGAGVVAASAFLLPGFLREHIGMTFAARVVTAIAVVAPTGLLLGVPFPSGLRLVERTAPSLVPWAWAVNGAGSVLGPILAMVVAIVWGFTAALLLGAGLYVVAAVVLAGMAAGPRRPAPAA